MRFGWEWLFSATNSRMVLIIERRLLGLAEPGGAQRLQSRQVVGGDGVGGIGRQRRGASRSLVAGSSSPVTGRCSFCWKARRAERVCEPMRPSSEPEEMPWRARASWASNTFWTGRGKPPGGGSSGLRLCDWARRGNRHNRRRCLWLHFWLGRFGLRHDLSRRRGRDSRWFWRRRSGLAGLPPNPPGHDQPHHREQPKETASPSLPRFSADGIWCGSARPDLATNARACPSTK